MAKTDAAYLERQQHWLQHIEAATASGETLASYAKAQGLKLADVYRWKSRLTARGVWPPAAKPIAPSRAFVPVAMAQGARCTTQCTVTFPNGVRLEFTGAFDAPQLRALFASLGALV
jgi:hypothetical protein